MLVAASVLCAHTATERADGQAIPLEVGGRIESVVVHQDEAAVVRRVPLEVAAGQYEVRLVDLPVTFVPGSLSISGSPGVAVQQIEFRALADEGSHLAAMSQLEGRIAAMKQDLSRARIDRTAAEKQEALFETLATQLAANAAGSLGTGSFDMEEFQRAVEGLTQQQSEVLSRMAVAESRAAALEAQISEAEAELAAMRETGPAERRVAVAQVRVSAEDGAGWLDVSYRVTGTGWYPRYNLRLNAENGQAALEYEAVILQESGEDWNDVRLSVSTGRATGPTGPPALRPWYITAVGRLESVPESVWAWPGGMGEGEETDLPISDQVLAEAFYRVDSAMRTTDARLPLTEYPFGQQATLASEAGEAYRLRIATIRFRPELMHVASPTVSQHAFLRGEVVNISDLHLMPGPVSVFVNDQFEGQSVLPYVPPSGRHTAFFGIDRRIRVERRLLRERKRNTGLLGDGRETTLEYLLTVTSETPAEVRLELWDRTPVTADDRVRINVVDIEPNLARDTAYRIDQRPLGLLRWDLTLEGGSAGRRERVVEYSVVISHYKDVTPVLTIP